MASCSAVWVLAEVLFRQEMFGSNTSPVTNLPLGFAVGHKFRHPQRPWQRSRYSEKTSNAVCVPCHRAACSILAENCSLTVRSSPLVLVYIHTALYCRWSMRLTHGTR